MFNVIFILMYVSHSVYFNIQWIVRSKCSQEKTNIYFLTELLPNIMGSPVSKENILLHKNC